MDPPSTGLGRPSRSKLEHVSLGVTSMSGRLAGKVAIVTGAGSGIGRAVALRFAAEGAKVVVNDLVADAAGRVAKEIEAAGGTALPCPGDVGDSRAVEALVRAATAKF